MKRTFFRMAACLSAVLMTVGLCACGSDATPTTTAAIPTTTAVTTTTALVTTTVGEADPTEEVTTVTESDTATDGDTTATGATSAATTGDPWGNATAPRRTTSTVAKVTTQDKSYSTLPVIERDPYFENKYGIYNAIKGYCYGEPLTVEDWLPVVAYLDKDGKVAGTMYEATTVMPSPKHVYWGYLDTKEQWDDWIYNQTFCENKALDALEQAVKRTKTALNLKDYKVKVFLTLFNPSDGKGGKGRLDNWGELNGVKMDIHNNDHRFEMVKYMVDNYIKAFNRRKYQHIELTGFYWFDEYLVLEEMAWYNRVNDYIESRRYISMISPYYKATGWDRCYEAGFDLVSMQSNYFPSSTNGLNAGPISRLTDNSTLVKKNRMGIEMEMDNPKKKNGVTGFKQTMEVCIRRKNVNGYHLDYYGMGPYAMRFLAEHEDPYWRSCYDELYLYMHNTLKVEDIWIEPLDPI